jgi:hypothetical protein
MDDTGDGDEDGVFGHARGLLFTCRLFILGVDMGVPVLEMALAECGRETLRERKNKCITRSLWPAHYFWLVPVATCCGFCGFVINNVLIWLAG